MSSPGEEGRVHTPGVSDQRAAERAEPGIEGGAFGGEVSSNRWHKEKDMVIRRG